MIELADAGVVARVSPRAASLRGLVVRGTRLVEPTAHLADPPGMSGAVLAPWPNRVEGARWSHGGRELQLEVTEPELGHALHGLLARTDFEVADRTSRGVTLVAAISPVSGYPFAGGVRVRYELTAHGVDVAIGASNAGAAPMPVAVGAHPYPRLGDWPVEDLAVSLDADEEWELDAGHIPRARRERRARPDPRRPRRVREAPTHALYERRTGVRRPVRHTLTAPDGRRLELRAAPGLRWTQWYLAPSLDTEDGVRTALAIEPMSAPPNALRTGIDLSWLAPGAVRTWRWALRLR